MNDDAMNHNRNIDDQLAEFTDQALSGKPPVAQEFTDNPELADLAETVERLQAMIEQDIPDPGVVQRIHAQIDLVWRHEQVSQAPLPQKNPRLPRAQQSLASWLRYAGAVALLILSVAILSSGSEQNLPATVLHNPGLVFGLLLGLAILVILILILTNRK